MEIIFNRYDNKVLLTEESVCAKVCSRMSIWSASVRIWWLSGQRSGINIMQLMVKTVIKNRFMATNDVIYDFH